jgi:hypothetical protein
MPLQKVMAETTVSEFFEWMEFFQVQRRESFEIEEKLDCYLAQLTTEVRRSWVKNPRHYKLSDFLLKFKKPSQIKPKTKKEAAEQAKRAWLGPFGIQWKDK